MNFEGLIIGLATFLIIGIFHPVVIKGEYHFGKRIWGIFFAMGILFLGLSVFTENIVYSSLLGVTAFCSFWTIKELYEQEERVMKGWYPRNPKRDYTEAERRFNLKYGEKTQQVVNFEY